MNDIFMTPYFKSKPDKSVEMLKQALKVPNPTTAELLGVLAFNARTSGGNHIFDMPLHIDLFEQRRLLDFGIVKRMHRSVTTEHDVPIASLTNFGEFVVSQIVLVNHTDDLTKIPRIDTESLLLQLS